MIVYSAEGDKKIGKSLCPLCDVHGYTNVMDAWMRKNDLCGESLLSF